MASTAGPARPMVRMHIEQLYFKWLSEEGTMTVLRENLQQLLAGESLQTMLAVPCHRPSNYITSNPTLSSPRPQTPPGLHRGHPSPRSPRRAFKSTKNIKLDVPSSDTRSQDSSSPRIEGPVSQALLDSRPSNATKHKRSDLPKFFFPCGRPLSSSEIEDCLSLVSKVFDSFPNKSVTLADMGKVAKACGRPLYWKQPIFAAALGKEAVSTRKTLSKDTFLLFWKSVLSSHPDESVQFIRLVNGTTTRSYLIAEDFVPLIQDIVDTHPGLLFLQEAPEFHGRYVNTVVARIFFDINTSWTGKITAGELRRSKLLRTLSILEEESDINLISDFFSYEHFYVIYCKFWDIDTDHDLLISKEDLRKHNNYTLSDRVIDRIFSGAVTKGNYLREGKMSYPEFVWFLLAEEDKRHPRSIEYWFRCLDLDGDGIITLFDLEYFYAEQMKRMEEARIEEFQGVDDCICTLLDMVKPQESNQIRLSDLRRCKLSHIFFDTLFNLHKFLDHEQRDPFSNLRDIQDGTAQLSDWERYATEMYELLVAEESNNADVEDAYPDDFEKLDADSDIFTRKDGFKFLESNKGSKEI